MFITKLQALMDQEGLTQSDIVSNTSLAQNTVRKFAKNQLDRVDSNTIQELMRFFNLTELSELLEFKLEGKTGRSTSKAAPKAAPKAVAKKADPGKPVKITARTIASSGAGKSRSRKSAVAAK